MMGIWDKMAKEQPAAPDDERGEVYKKVESREFSRRIGVTKVTVSASTSDTQQDYGKGVREQHIWVGLSHPGASCGVFIKNRDEFRQFMSMLADAAGELWQSNWRDIAED